MLPKKTILYLYILTAIIFTIYGCEKEYSYEGGALINTETAVYQLTDSSGNCSVNVSGDYFSGTALATGHDVLLQVYVTETGTYSISTSSINGIQFSASGIFNTTGIQSIRLTGTGTPASSGDYDFSIRNASCSFTIHVMLPQVVNSVFTLAGAPDFCTDAIVSGTYILGRAMTSANTVAIKVDVASPGAYNIQTDTLNRISFSATGTFTTTGIQTVILTASGTPHNPANLTFSISAGVSICTFDVTVRNPEPLATYVLESGFGTTNPLCTGYSRFGDYTQGTTLTNTNYISVQVYVTEPGNFTIATNTGNGIEFSYTGAFTTTGTQYVNLYGSGTPLAAGIFSFIPRIVGPYPLGGEFCAFGLTVQ